MFSQSNPVINRQRGFSLLEALVAFLVLSVGMLGIASLQVISLKAGRTAAMRTIVVVKVEEIFERMRANPRSISDYVSANVAGASNGCNSYVTPPYKNCTDFELAKDDLYNWIEELKALMPNTNVKASISMPAIDPAVTPLAGMTVTVTWEERATETQTLESMTYSATADICPNTSC